MIFHLAAQLDVRVSVARPMFDAEVNILGSLNVCEARVAAGTRKVVFAGSGGTLYGTPESIPVREGHPQRPMSPYGVSKKAVGDYLHYYREVHGLEYTVLALANVYGPRQDPHGEAGVVAIFAGQLLAGKQPDDLRRRRADARLRATSTTWSTRSCAPPTRAAGCSMNIGTGVETSVQELFDAMADSPASSSRAALRAPRARASSPRSALDPGRAAIHLGWKPWTDARRGPRAHPRLVPAGS